MCVGQEGEYLDAEARTIDLSGAEARGPTGVAVLEGHCDVCNDLDEERSRPWRASNTRAGFRSSAAFPIREDGNVIGTLSVYATTVGYFDAKFVELLSRIAAGLSLGLDNLRRDARRTAIESALRDSESRFRSLTELSADWYWQQDENLRFTAVAGGTRGTSLLRPDLDIGKTRWELPLTGVSEQAWTAHKAMLAACLPFRDFQFRRIVQGGEERYVSVSGTPVYGADGRFAGYRGIGTDLTERKNAERVLALEQEVGRCLADGDDPLTAISQVIRAVCESQGWSCGFFSRADEDAGILRIDASWGLPTPEFDAFRAAAHGAIVPRDSSLAGHAWRAGQPLWAEDVAAYGPLPRRDLIVDAGLRCGFAFPVTAEEKTLGALTFLTSKARGPDPRLEAAARIIGAQVSQFLKRKDAEEALRESEARFHSLSDLSAEWYWQQDAQLRFTSLCNGTEIEAGLAPDADLGKTRWELSGVGEALWDLHKQTLAERRPFVDFEMKRRFPDGSVRDVSVSGTPIFDAGGNFAGYRGIGREITRRKREAGILALEHRVARCIAAAGEQASVLGEVIRAICETQGWDWGAYLRVDEVDNVLRLETDWARSRETSAQLDASARMLTIPPDAGISGRVWRSGQPLWMADARTDSRVLFADAVLAAGFRGGFAFPIIADGRTIGVLLFFSRDMQEPDERLLSAARMIGAQVGQCLQRRQAEDALRESEKRYRALTELSSDWYWEQDENQHFTRISEGIEQRAGVKVASLIGHSRWAAGVSYIPADRQALDALIEARRAFRDFAYIRTDADGKVRHVAISGEPMFDAAGRYMGYRGIGRDVTERTLANERLRFQAMLLNTVGDAVMAADMEDTISYWSTAAEQLYGWTAAEAIGKKMLDMVRPADETQSPGEAKRIAAQGLVWRGEKVGQRRDGTTFPVNLTLAPVQDTDGNVTGMVSVSRDITETKRAENAIRDSARRQGVIAAFGQRALASSSVHTLLDEAVGAVVEGLAVPFCRIVQLAPDGQSLVAKAECGFPDGEADRHAADGCTDSPDHHVLKTREAVVIDDYAQESRFAPPAAFSRHAIRSGANVIIGGAEGPPFGVLGAYASNPAYFGADSVNFLQSIANTLATAVHRVAAEEKVAYLAQFDAMTGLPNRNLFRDRLALTLTQAQRNSWNVGVMFVDLDGFKNVNDTFGHGAGDHLLTLVAERLRKCVRSGDTVGRLGGDEFGVVLSDLAQADDANVVAQQIVDTLAQPFEVMGSDIRITGSVGISVYPADATDPEVLLKNADAAMYRAKQKGRNGFHFFTDELHARATRRMGLEAELRRAIDNDEFILHYQPQVSLDTGRIIGVEALVRWQHPVRGLVAPLEFIGIAEETGLIVPIGAWVAKTACAQVAQWHRRGHRGLFAAINVSPLEIRRGHVLGTIGDALAQSGLDPRYLEIELTETLIMDGAESFVRSLEALKATGINIAIDDFGTGYSSLSYLKRFPIDKVKIDRIFINDIVSEVDDAAIVQAIIAMSHHLKLQVTAEGVETQEQAEFLRRCQCDIVQGFLFGHPVPAAEMSATLDSHGSLPLLRGPQGTSRSLLIVDDEENNLRALQRVLRRDGYDIHTALSAPQALEVLANTRISVIVADQRMPGMSGTELLARAKSLYPDTVRIILSGFTDLGTITSAINEGAVYKFLTKPWEDEALREDIRGAFRLYEQKRVGGGSASLTAETSV